MRNPRFITIGMQRRFEGWAAAIRYTTPNGQLYYGANLLQGKRITEKELAEKLVKDLLDCHDRVNFIES